jgi:outer membrane protein OmpA-like peptidoglycan-associated protein
MRIAGWLLTGLCLLPLPSQAAEQVIDVRLTDKVVPGIRPSLTVSVFADLKSIVLDLRRDDGKRIHEQRDTVARGSKRVFELPQTSGRHHYRGSLRITAPSGETGSMNLDFVAQIMPSMGLRVGQDDLDLQARKLTVHAKRPLSRVDYEILAETGDSIGAGSFEAQQPGTSLPMAWEQRPGKVLKIHLTVHDTEGFSEVIDLFPWSWSVPHEELVFETGKWDIQPAEVPKLEHSYEQLQQGLAKYGKLLPIELYIAGYTDTVAAAETNQALSDKRALAIARYFRNKGFSYPIFYQGFGERGLKVVTPDETDEPLNRRAEYVLAAEPPDLQVPGAAAGWKRL